MFAFISYQDLPLLKQLRLPFMTAGQLDDPYLINKRVHQPRADQPLSDSEFRTAMEKSYHALEPHIQAMVTFEYYLTQAQQNRADIEKQIQRPKSPKQLGLASLDQYDKVVVLRLFRQIYLSGLWQSAGYNHQGIALQLNDDHDYLQASNYAQKPQLLAPLQYDDARPPMPSKQQPFPALFTRAEHFAFEQETRLVRPSTVADQSKDGVVNCKIPKGLIQGIYAGLNCPDDVVMGLQALVKQDLQFRGVPLKQIGVSASHLRLVATNLSL